MNTIFPQRPWLSLAAGAHRCRLLVTALAFLLTLLSSVVLAQTDEVLSCGSNQFGQIGDHTTTNRSLLTPAHTISGIKAIACGYGHTLALDSTGTVWAWGYNANGQLGTGDTTNRTTPVAVLSGIKAIAAGTFHSLALDAGGTVYAWGYNGQGQLGLGDTTDRLTPTYVSGVSRIKAIACGSYHSLMLDDSTHLYACGWNYFGQLGTHDNTDRWFPTPTLTDPSDGFQWSGVQAIAAGYGHSVIIWTYNTPWATGYNGDGELGDNTTTTRNYFQPCGTGSTGFVTARSIAAGLFHTLAVLPDGTVQAWGRNGEGELGTHDLTNRLIPTSMPGAANVKAVVGGGYHSLVLQANGAVLATGDNTYGQLGNGTTTSRNQLAAVKDASLIGSIAAGQYDSALLKPFTKSLATGYNNYGQLGIGSVVSQQNMPASMKIGNNIIAVSAGPSGWHSLMLKADGTVWACGDNDFGQLGIGTTTSSFTPVEVKGPNGVGHLSNIIAIAAGNFHSMALAADGTVYTWGRNSHGQLGTGDTTDRYYPVQVLGSGSNIIAIAAGGYHSLVLQALLNISSACGYNGYGQLGVGDTTDRSSFTYINANSNPITSLAGGNFHSLVLADYVLGPFGLNSNGQLGDGTTTEQTTPEFESGTIAIAMAEGGFHTLHLNAAGEVFGAGYNGDGELGLGDTNDRWNWSYNPFLFAIGIACGYDHSLFLDPFGNLYASGYGYYGQLGNGSTASQVYPTQVTGASFTTGMAGGWGHTLILTTPLITVASIKVSPSSVVGGSSATGTVTLNGLAGAGGQRVYLSHSTGPVSLPSYVDVAPTSKTATFKITTSGVHAKTVVNIYANLYYQVSTSLTLTP